GAFALLGVFITVLNSLGRQWASLSLTAAATTMVVGLNWWWVSDAPFGPGLLMRTAQATGVGMLLATLLGGALVQRWAGGVISWLTFARVVLATVAVIALGLQLPVLGRVLTVAASAGL